jgi:hypothetical protein
VNGIFVRVSTCHGDPIGSFTATGDDAKAEADSQIADLQAWAVRFEPHTLPLRITRSDEEGTS